MAVLGPTSSAVVGQGLSDVYRKRQPVPPAAFAVNDDLAGAPVHVVQTK
jgi:hypothetical protein